MSNKEISHQQSAEQKKVLTQAAIVILMHLFLILLPNLQ